MSFQMFEGIDVLLIGISSVKYCGARMAFAGEKKENDEDLNQDHFFCDLNLETSWRSITDVTS